jgi:hypothetical protein
VQYTIIPSDKSALASADERNRFIFRFRINAAIST